MPIVGPRFIPIDGPIIISVVVIPSISIPIPTERSIMGWII